jgi:hypothetical protein
MAAKLWVSGGSTMRDHSCWRASWMVGCVVRNCFSDSSAPPRCGAGGRRRGRKAGPKASSGARSGAEGSHRHPLSESVLGEMGGTVSPA